ncbi:unnamed protein product [Adineta steineri]|uniref:Reverse transcriptase domain-containing protein n=1 Tax=Adineta steineri TaxID=433720 RepID=A0A815VKE6_9BILA|nr:unnamed protein product [Adineta steineri]
MTNIEEHLKSHDITLLEYKCGACHKPWRSWRAAIAHYSRSNCRHSTSATPTFLTADPPSSTNVIDQSTTTIEQLQNTTTNSAVNEESEAEEQIQTIGNQSSDETTQQLGNDGNAHSPSVIPKTQKIADVQNVDIPANDGKQSDDEQINGDHGIISNTRKENNVEMKETDEKYYCEFCASGGFNKKAGLSQHKRHMHPNEYNATIEVPMKKRLWTRDDILILAELEANLTSSEAGNPNSALALKLPSRSREAIKKRRQTTEYKTLLQQVRESKAAITIEESDDSEKSIIVNSLTIANDSINNNVNNSGNHNSNDRSQGTQVGTNNESYPDIRQYTKTNIMKGRIRLCQTMCDAMTHYVNDVPNSDPVNESLNGIHQAINSVQSSQSRKDDKQTIGSKLRSAKSIAKAQKYAHYQCLFKKDKSKLASEIFDGVDNSAVKPPMSVAYEHYKKIWTIDTKDAEITGRKASVGTDVLLAPITREEIAWAIDQTNTKTALGPDRLPLVTIKAIAKNELWCAFNIWLGYRRIPDSLKINRTVLLPKGKDNLDNIKNWRPITIASLLLRLYNKILARRMQNVFRTNSKQKGFKPLNGVGQNVALLHNLLRHARTNKNNLFVCLLDVSKAFDSVPHESIKRALLRNGCPLEFIDLFNNQYENSYTALSYADRSSRLIALRRGVKQGDPMSSILFNLVIDELFEILGDRFGYELDGVGSVNARAFADDIALMSGSELGMQKLLSETEAFLGARGLVLNADKCISICLRKAGKVKKSQIADSSVKNPPQFTVKNQPIQLLGVDKSCRYLGVQFSPLGAVDPRVTVSAIKSALSSLSKAPLKPQQKVVMLRTYLIPRFIFAFTHTECYPKLMGQQDRLIRRWLKETLKLPPSVCSDFFYLPVKEGGLGIGKLYDIIGIAKVRLHSSFHRANDMCLQFLVDTQGSAMHSRWCNAMKLSDRPSAADINQRNVLSINESRIRLAETVHGSGSTVFRESPITNQWLSGYTRIMKGRTYIKAIQMRTNTTPTRVSTTRGQNTNKACRRCGLADETLIHILQTCPLTQGMRCRRHNNVCRKVSDKLRSKGFQVYSEQGLPSPGLQTNISRPDIIAVQGEKALVLDITCVYESNSNSFPDAYRRKVNRYSPLEETVKQKFQVRKVEFQGLVIGSRGAYDPKHLAIWHSMGFSGTELGMLAIGVIEDSLRTITLFNNANRLRI